MITITYTVREAHKHVDLLPEHKSKKEDIVNFLKSKEEPNDFDVRVSAFNTYNFKFNDTWGFGGDFLEDPDQFDYVKELVE